MRTTDVHQLVDFHLWTYSTNFPKLRFDLAYRIAISVLRAYHATVSLVSAIYNITSSDPKKYVMTGFKGTETQ